MTHRRALVAAARVQLGDYPPIRTKIVNVAAASSQSRVAAGHFR